MALALTLTLAMQQRLGSAHTPLLIGLYFCGGLIGWFLALPVARFLALGAPVPSRLAASLLLLTLASVSAAAILFALQYRIFYAQWHQPFGTIIWVFQFVFTSASAVYQFAVLGFRLLMPFGFLVLLGASMVLSRLIR